MNPVFQLCTCTSLTDDETTNIIPASDNMIIAAINWSANSIYECNNKEQLIKYYHTSFGSHVKSTFLAAARAGYFQGCPGLTKDANARFIMVEDATEMGHMTKSPAGARSTTIKSN